MPWICYVLTAKLVFFLHKNMLRLLQKNIHPRNKECHQDDSNANAEGNRKVVHHCSGLYWISQEIVIAIGAGSCNVWDFASHFRPRRREWSSVLVAWQCVSFFHCIFWMDPASRPQDYCRIIDWNNFSKGMNWMTCVMNSKFFDRIWKKKKTIDYKHD